MLPVAIFLVLIVLMQRHIPGQVGMILYPFKIGCLQMKLARLKMRELNLFDARLSVLVLE